MIPLTICKLPKAYYIIWNPNWLHTLKSNGFSNPPLELAHQHLFSVVDGVFAVWLDTNQPSKRLLKIPLFQAKINWHALTHTRFNFHAWYRSKLRFWDVFLLCFLLEPIPPYNEALVNYSECPRLSWPNHRTGYYLSVLYSLMTSYKIIYIYIYFTTNQDMQAKHTSRPAIVWMEYVALPLKIPASRSVKLASAMLASGKSHWFVKDFSIWNKSEELFWDLWVFSW